ncbi:MAG: DtxR family transcriptional regulator [Methanobacterium sp.]|uniref:metal-dependent transcriptional regulator n=1 Tax=Methanobacterium sp. TaxID=2164 RepID=UPI003D64AB53|nr:DtxR family transcriptional regulator [Methanobacterium sp.]
MSGKELSENVEEYLEVIYKLSPKGKMVTTSQISEKLEIAPASVTQMLKKLSKKGYVTYSPYKGAVLTEEGLKIAKKVTRKHRLLERFLCDVLKIKKHKIHEQACEMEHSLSDDAERALCHLLEHPNKCPGDSVIPECDLKFTSCEECLKRKEDDIEEVGKRNENLIPILELKKDKKGKVSFIRGDYKIIRRLLDMGITMGAIINVIKVAPLGGPVEVAVRGSKLAIGHDIASNVFVEAIDEERC